jgi:sterile alpha motif and leucine zipper-containing kinase AZK
MSKMKHLLRKLHIGGGLNEHHRFGEARPTTNPSPSPSPSTPASSSSASGSATMGRIGAFESADDRMAGDGCVDFNLLEEEFQMQMALAISASDPDSREDPETAQINAAKRISLGCAAPVPDSQAVVKFLSLRYWVGREIDSRNSTFHRS